MFTEAMKILSYHGASYESSDCGMLEVDPICGRKNAHELAEKLRAAGYSVLIAPDLGLIVNGSGNKHALDQGV